MEQFWQRQEGTSSQHCRLPTRGPQCHQLSTGHVQGIQRNTTIKTWNNGTTTIPIKPDKELSIHNMLSHNQFSKSMYSLYDMSGSGATSVNNVAASQDDKKIQLNAQSPRHLRDFWAVIIDTSAAIS
eukprot:2277066-Amphidinium_carterae.1